MPSLIYLVYLQALPAYSKLCGNQLIEAEWRMYASVQRINIGSDICLLPIRIQAIIWSNGAILSIAL